jgi:hypothetical protein
VVAKVLDAGGGFDCSKDKMNAKILSAVAVTAAVAAAVVATGCVKTVSDTHAPAYSWGQDTVEGRYQRSVDQVYQAAMQVVQSNGVVVTEYIPHDTTNTVRSLLGRVNDRKVWVRVEQVDPRITQVDVQARTKMGGKDLDLVHELEKEIALKLAQTSPAY